MYIRNKCTSSHVNAKTGCHMSDLPLHDTPRDLLIFEMRTAEAWIVHWILYTYMDLIHIYIYGTGSYTYIYIYGTGSYPLDLIYIHIYGRISLIPMYIRHDSTGSYVYVWQDSSDSHVWQDWSDSRIYMRQGATCRTSRCTTRHETSSSWPRCKAL